MTLPTIRNATPGDVDDLARIHVQAWQETYPGLLPESEIESRDFGVRQQQWTGQIARNASRITIAPGLGFAQMGPQREAHLAEDWPEELYAIYALAHAHGTGLGQHLLDAVRGPRAFTALVLDGNARAHAFYLKTGAKEIARRALEEGWPDDIVLGWPMTDPDP